MKKIISIVLAVMLVVSVAAVSAGAYNSDGDYSKLSPDGYNPADSYTVDANTPYSEEAILACGGDLSETQTMYFQAPADWANEFNTFEGPDDSEPYMHVCAYWWSGIAGSDDKGWPSGKGCKWVGYQAHLVDKANRIYSIQMPNDGGSPTVVWDNGVNGGMDQSAAIFKYGRQILDANTEGAVEGDYDTLPEGSPTQDDFDGCIQIIDYTVKRENPLTHFDSYGSNWYVYYGKGCYGSYSTDSDNFTSRYDNCLNPEHLADPDKYHPAPGDVNQDKITDVLDAELIQEYLVKLEDLTDTQKDIADVDEDGYISVIDATRIQRYVAGICEIDGTKK